MSIMEISMSFTLLCLGFIFPVLAQQNVQFNQVLNLNGDMQLNTFVFPDNSKIETFSQEQTQLIVNQNPNPLSATHVVGSSGQPFVQLSQSSMTIQTNGQNDLVAGQIEMPIDPNALAQIGVSADNTFVAMLSQDRQAWIVMETVKSVNGTDSTVRMVKLTSLDGEYMAVGRRTVETGQVLSPFGQDAAQAITITGSGIQEVEFQDGFRMSVRAVQPMTVNTDVVNGVSSSMITDGSMPVNNYRYLVTTSLGGVVPGLNDMASVVQIPLNADRVMRMAQAMGAPPNGAITLGISQRGVLRNPGGATNNLPPAPRPQKRQETSTASDAAQTAPPDAASSVASDASVSSSATDASASALAAPTDAAVPPVANAASNTLPQAAAASQLLLEPTFTPINAQPILDRENSRLAIPVAQLDGEFILTMTLAGAAQPGQAAVGQQPAREPAGAPPPPPAGAAPPREPAGVQAPPPPPGAAPAAEPAGALEGRQLVPAQSGMVMTMAELQAMVQREQDGRRLPVWQMMDQFQQAQRRALAADVVAERRDEAIKAVPFVG